MSEAVELVVVRHGVARPAGGGESDFDRPLTHEGKIGVERVGRWLRERPIAVDVILTSAALRARDTAAIIAANLKDAAPVQALPALYSAEAADILAQLSCLTDVRCVVLVGHNPTLEALVSYLVGEPAGASPKVRLVPGGCVCLRWLAGWAGTAYGVATLGAAISPGELTVPQSR
jgi:phosphohistidine phosphatase